LFLEAPPQSAARSRPHDSVDEGAVRNARAGVGFLLAVVVTGTGCGGNRAAAPSAAPGVAYELEIDGRTAVLDLTPNTTVLSKDYREYAVRGPGVEEMPRRAQTPTCMYRGLASWADGGASAGPAWAALNTCNGFEGLVAIDGETWILSPGSAKDQVLLSRMSEGLGARVKSATIRLRAAPAASAGALEEQASALTTPSKYLELVLVSDAARSAAVGTNTTADSLQLANLVDAIYRNGTLTPSIAIVVTANVVIPGRTDPWSVPPTGPVDPMSLINGFTTWAGTHLPTGDDYALLSGRTFAGGGEIGLAFVSSACTANKDAIVEATLTHAQVSAALAHELGHTLGMVHDEQAGCPGGPFVMSANQSIPPSTTWSSCSTGELAAFLSHLGSPGCLDNVPSPNLGPRCGDGVRDPGEQCDCGSQNCAGYDPCCNGATCQLIAGAACSALDGCCNNCQIAAAGSTCAVATVCTPPATCSGVSSVCSLPAPFPNGTACPVGTFSDGACFQGQCESRTQQCDALFSGATPCPGSTGCGDLECFMSSFGGCFFVGNGDGSGDGNVQVGTGSSCGTSGQQCYQGACVSSTTPPRCANGMPVNACGGCSTLATAPGAVCNTCGVTKCLSAGEVGCSVANASACAPAHVPATGLFARLALGAGLLAMVVVFGGRRRRGMQRP
jgi:disintegrin and metalloproteinase domain-containing protein 9